jgi:ribosomal protein L39E
MDQYMASREPEKQNWREVLPVWAIMQLDEDIERCPKLRGWRDRFVTVEWYYESCTRYPMERMYISAYVKIGTYWHWIVK